jgi:hypothetical protein
VFALFLSDGAELMSFVSLARGFVSDHIDAVILTGLALFERDLSSVRRNSLIGLNRLSDSSRFASRLEALCAISYPYVNIR